MFGGPSGGQGGFGSHPGAPPVFGSDPKKGGGPQKRGFDQSRLGKRAAPKGENAKNYFTSFIQRLTLNFRAFLRFVWHATPSYHVIR